MSVSSLPVIIRSQGIRVDGYTIGGGVTGATAELDAMVNDAAEALCDWYGRNVMIRFNSDRRSGGAWLITHTRDAIGRNSEIGICIDYAIRDRDAVRRALAVLDDPESPISEMDRLLAAIPRMLSVFAYIGTASLRDPAKAEIWYAEGNALNDQDRPYTHRLCDSIADAIFYLSENAVLRERY